jgi:Kef-type K+ transport system membrane component KefB
VTFALALAVELAAWRAGLVVTPLLVAIALSATSAGIVVPLLHDSGRLDSTFGQFTLAGASVAEFGTIVLLGLFFSARNGSTLVEAVLLLVFAVLSLAALRLLRWFSRGVARQEVLLRLHDTSDQLRVRLALAMLLGAAVVAASFGFENILGAFLAGAVVGAVAREWQDVRVFRIKLEAAGFGFFVPVFYIAVGLRFDAAGMLTSGVVLGRAAGLVVVLLVVHLAAMALYRRFVKGPELLATGLLQATNLSFVIVAVEVGERNGALTRAGGDSLVAAGLVSAILFPGLADRLLRRGARSDAAADGESPGRLSAVEPPPERRTA